MRRTLTGDEAEIRDLQLAYATHFDARDPDAYAALFTDDALIVQHNGHSFTGHAKLRKAVMNMPPPNGAFHRMLGTRIELHGDHAEARCDFFARTAAGDRVEGHYQDIYRRTPAGWRIARRVVFVDNVLDPTTSGPAED